MSASTCKDNATLRREGCGQGYSGGMGHCVAPAPWSTHADGICHATFSTQNVSDLHWVRGVHTDPALVVDKAGTPKLRQDGRGVWRMAGERPTDWQERPSITPESDANGSDGSR